MKFAEAVPCSHNEYDAQTTAKISLNKWFSRHGTQAMMQSDNATNFTAEIAREPKSHPPLLTQEKLDSWNNNIEQSSPCFESVYRTGCKIETSI